jgi:hypothetical protein
LLSQRKNKALSNAVANCRKIISTTKTKKEKQQSSTTIINNPKVIYYTLRGTDPPF